MTRRSFGCSAVNLLDLSYNLIGKRCIRVTLVTEFPQIVCCKESRRLCDGIEMIFEIKQVENNEDAQHKTKEKHVVFGIGNLILIQMCVYCYNKHDQNTFWSVLYYGQAQSIP